MRSLTEFGTESFTTPRSLPEFEAAITSILARGQKTGQTFYKKDPESGKATVSRQPGIDDVLYKLRYTDSEKQALAAALLAALAAAPRAVVLMHGLHIERSGASL